MVIIDSSTDKVVTNVSVAQLVERLEAAHSAAPSAGKPRLEVVITGPALAHLHTNMDAAMFLRLLRRVAVFARTKPSQKKLVVTELKKPLPGKTEQSYVMFCGDGANDMEALAAATVGVSLCDTATTVAASIVSVNQSPYSTVEVLAEGRCSLVTAYILVSYNIMYAIIQLFMTCYLNNVGLIFGDGMYLVQDMFYSLVLGLCIANTPPEDRLCTRLPPKRLFSVGLMVKLLLQLGIFPIFQYIALELLYQEHWFEKFDAGDDPLTEAWAAEGAVLNVVALAQLMIASVVVTIGRPFRNPWYTNKSHLGCMALQAAYILYLMFAAENEFSHVVTNYPVKAHFYGIIIGIIAANAAASALATHVADYFFAFDEYLDK
jgi:cation-transporting ATPase 13A3/4/5